MLDDFVDVALDSDYTQTNHPGPKSHELYYEKLKKIIEEKCK